MVDVAWQIELFGRLCLKQGEQAVTRFRTHKTGALLAYLAYFLGRSHVREVLIDLFWPEDDLEAGRNSLRVALNALRQTLEPPGTPPGSVLLTDRTHVQLNPAVCSTDVAQFDSALRAETLAATDAERIALLRTAIDLYREGLLPEYDAVWIVAERQRLLNSYLGALRKLVRYLAQARDFDQAIDYAWRAIRADPLREEAHRNLMRLYVAIGRPAAALQQFHELERILRTELNVAPSAATRELADQLARPFPTSTPKPAHATSSNERSAQVPGRNLTSPATRFFGREEEIALLLLRIQDPETRLITLIGPGGAGKTRLALEALQRLKSVSPIAVWSVGLADVTETDRLLNLLLDTLLPQRADSNDLMAQIVTALRRQPAVLVLDNFEQITENGVEIVQTLLDQVPTLTCLVTSRQRLNLASEHEFPVLPLPTPTLPGTPERLLEFASVQLFVDRARTVRPEFQVTRANAAAIATLCHRLEGLPLAIELAAAWIPTLTPAQMLPRLARRFDLLVSRNRDLPLRHRTLWAAVEWSHRLLPPELQAFFARLSVFHGGWTVEAAEKVCDFGLNPTPGTTRPQQEQAPIQNPKPKIQNGGVLDCLAQLRERSLVVTEETPLGMRFRLLETLREYAATQLATEEAEILARRHAQYYLQIAQEADTELLGPEQALWLERLEQEHENLRTALAWCLAEPGDREIGLRLAAALWRFWFVRGYLPEGRSWLEKALLKGEHAPENVRAKALHAAGNLAWGQGDYATARTYYEACLDRRRRLDDRRGIASTLGNLGNVALHQGAYTEAQSLYEESLSLFRELKEPRGIANSLQNLGNIAADQSDYATAQRLYEESLRLFRALEDRQSVANLLSNLGTAAREQGALDYARRLFEESLMILQELGAKNGVAIALQNLGYIALDQRDTSGARSAHEQSLTLFQELGDKRGIAYALQAFAALATAERCPERAVRLLGGVEALRASIGAPLPPNEQMAFDQTCETAREALSPETFASLWREGRTMEMDQAIHYALERPEETTVSCL